MTHKRLHPLDWCFRQALHPTHALVLRTIAKSINSRDNFGWNTLVQIAAFSNFISLSTAKRSIKDLIDLDLIRIEKRPSRNGHLHNIYFINLTRVVRWDRSTPWRTFVVLEKQKRREASFLAGEPKSDFVSRQMARSVLPLLGKLQRIDATPD